MRMFFTIDPKGIEKLVTDKTKAIVATHIYGQAADMDPILAIAKERGLKVVEDAAQAHLAKYKNRPVGDLGDAAIFSFYPSKNLGALGEGGCVTSRDAALLEQIRILRAHGSKCWIQQSNGGASSGFFASQTSSFAGQDCSTTMDRPQVFGWHPER